MGAWDAYDHKDDCEHYNNPVTCPLCKAEKETWIYKTLEQEMIDYNLRITMDDEFRLVTITAFDKNLGAHGASYDTDQETIKKLIIAINNILFNANLLGRIKDES